MRAFVRRIDTKLTHSLTKWPASLRPLWLLITNLGHPIVAVLIGGVIVYVGRMESNVELSISGGLVWVVLAVGSILKQLFKRARPVTDYAANIWLDKLSFPSGHTTGATIAYGLLGYYAWQLLSQPLATTVAAMLTLLIVMVGLSRVYLGAHFPSDVVAGWLLGALGLTIVIVTVAATAAEIQIFTSRVLN